MEREMSKTAVRIQLTLAAALAAAGLASAARAQDPVELRVVDRNTGRVLQTWRHDGRLFVAGQPGARYSLRVINHTDGRVLVVMSVDGVNILTGETASYDQRGYVFTPYQSYDVTGWRKSNTQVAAFTFAPLSQSYAARTGRPTDVGVIGVAVFRERVVVPPPPPEPEQEPNQWNEDSSGYPGARAPAPMRAAPPAPPPPASLAAPTDRAAAAGPSGAARGGLAGGALSEQQDQRLGTGHGAREWSAITTVDFERATAYPQFTRQIEYDTYAHLVANGVIPAPSQTRPRPFPSSQDNEGYVPDPPENY
jgi:hypothetical protein